nr:hypothetical protein [Tanacetum cinerariifolium]
MVVGFLWERVGKVIGSSWSVEEWQEEWGEAVAGLAGVGMNSISLKRRGKTGVVLGFYTIGPCGFNLIRVVTFRLSTLVDASCYDIHPNRAGGVEPDLSSTFYVHATSGNKENLCSSLNVCEHAAYEGSALHSNSRTAAFMGHGVKSLGSIYVDVSCEGYLEDAVEINSMDNAYYTPFASMF